VSPGAGVGERLAAVRERIERAAARAGRGGEEITLVGVSKGQPAQAVIRAVRAGLSDVGENYLQEASAKIQKVEVELEGLGSPVPRWHFIGRLQRNKVRDVVRHFDAVETVDRDSLGAELERRAAQANRRLRVLLQVNLSNEPQKGGVAPEQLEALLAASADWSQLEVAGLMTVPAAQADPERSRPAFARLRELRDQLREAPGGAGLHELSMGMTADFEVAIEEGATIVRVGTGIFGTRPDRATSPRAAES
jgi:pyridoxal phosphate enzyme (YggS family)